MISHDDVRYVAKLARLKLDDGEVDSFSRQLSAVLGYMEQLNRTDTEGVAPTCYVTPEHDPLRDDVATGSLSKDTLLANGPKIRDGFFAVPKVIAQ